MRKAVIAALACALATSACGTMSSLADRTSSLLGGSSAGGGSSGGTAPGASSIGSSAGAPAAEQDRRIFSNSGPGASTICAAPPGPALEACMQSRYSGWGVDTSTATGY